MGAQCVSQRGMDQVGRGVCPGALVPIQRIHLGNEHVTDRDVARLERHGVTDEPRYGFLHVEDSGNRAVASKHTVVGYLPSRLCVEGSFGKNDLHTLSLRGAGNADAVVNDAEHLRARLQ